MYLCPKSVYFTAVSYSARPRMSDTLRYARGSLPNLPESGTSSSASGGFRQDSVTFVEREVDNSIHRLKKRKEIRTQQRTGPTTLSRRLL